MPKVVNHEKYKIELATKAAGLFSRHGYSALGMRKIADELGISKSALYHYFSSKEDLFSAATQVFMDFARYFKEAEMIKEEPLKKRIKAYFCFVESFESAFPEELSLLVDYLRYKSFEEVRNDPNMIFSTQKFLKLSQLYVGIKHAKGMLCLIQGLLLQRHFDGRVTGFDEIQNWVTCLLDEGVE